MPAGRKPISVCLPEEHVEELQQALARRTTEQRIAARSRVLLLSHEGLGPCAIGEKVGWHPGSVCRFLARYRRRGIAAIHDADRSGRPRRFSPSG